MAIDFRTALTISGVTVQPGYPALAGLTAGQLLRASGANTVAFTALVAADLPATAVTPGSYTLANITVDAQGRITAAAHGSSSALTDGTAGYIPFFTGADTYSSDAALFWDNTNKRLGIGTVSPSVRLHVPWLSGDATATAVFGSSNSSNNQVAVQGTSYSSLGLYGISTTNVGVFGLTTSGTPMVAERSDDATATTPTLLALRHNSSAAALANFGGGLLFQFKTDTTPNQNAALITAAWSDPANGTRSAYLAFHTVNNAAALAEKMRLTATGQLIIRGTVTTNASSLYLPTVAGDTLPLLYVGGQSSDALQVGIQAFSLTKEAIIGTSYNSAGVLGQMNNALGVGVVAAFDSDTSTNTLPTVALFRHRSTATAVANFGVQIGFQGKSSSTNDQEMAYISTYWTDPAHNTRTSILTFATVYSGLAASAKMFLTGYGYLGLNVSAPAGDLHIRMRDQEVATAGIVVDGLSSTSYASQVVLRRSAGTYGTPTATANSTELGRVSFSTYTASGWGEGANIQGINVTGGEARADLVFNQSTGGSWVEVMRMRAGKVGIGTAAPTKALHIASAVAGDSLYMSYAGPSLDLGNNMVFASATMHGLLSLSTSAGHYGLAAGDVMLAAYGDARGDLYINSNYSGTGTTDVIIQPTTGFVGIGVTAPAATLDIVRSAAVQLRLASLSGSGSTFMAYSTGTTESLYIMVNRTYSAGAFSRIDTGQASWTLSMGSQDADTFKIYRETSAGALSTLFQIDASGNAETIKGGTIRAVESTYAAPSGGAGLEIAATGGNGYVQSYNRAGSAWRPLWLNGSTINFGGGVAGGGINASGDITAYRYFYPGNQGTYYMGVWGGSGIFVTNHLLVNGAVFPGNQGSYYLSYTASPAGLIVTGNLSSYHDIFPGNNNGTGGSQNASYYLRGETNSGGIRTNGSFFASASLSAGSYLAATGGLGTNHLTALCGSGLYTLVFSGLGGYSYTSGGIGYNFGNINSGSSGQITGSQGGGFIRWHQDGQIHIASMNTSGTVGIVFYAGLNNVGIGVQQGSNNRLFSKGIDSTSSNNAFLCQNSNGSNLMYVRNDGQVWANQAWTISDLRFKENVVTIPYGLRHILQLRPIAFDYIDGLKQQLGFGAQDVRAIIPELVTEEAHNDDYAEHTGRLAVQSTGLIPILVKAMQEQQQRIDAQAAQIAALIARIDGQGAS